MANFANGYVLTKKGAALMADVEAGKLSLKLTRVQLGSGTVNRTSDYDSRTALVTPQNSRPITALPAPDASDSAAKAALSTTAAAGYSDSAKASASTAATNASTATTQATASAASATAAASTEEKVAAMNKAMLFDIIGPPPEEMNNGHFIVGAGPAAM